MQGTFLLRWYYTMNFWILGMYLMLFCVKSNLFPDCKVYFVSTFGTYIISTVISTFGTYVILTFGAYFMSLNYKAEIHFKSRGADRDPVCKASMTMNFYWYIWMHMLTWLQWYYLQQYDETGNVMRIEECDCLRRGLAGGPYPHFTGKSKIRSHVMPGKTPHLTVSGGSLD